MYVILDACGDVIVLGATCERFACSTRLLFLNVTGCVEVEGCHRLALCYANCPLASSPALRSCPPASSAGAHGRPPQSFACELPGVSLGSRAHWCLLHFTAAGSTLEIKMCSAILPSTKIIIKIQDCWPAPSAALVAAAPHGGGAPGIPMSNWPHCDVRPRVPRADWAHFRAQEHRDASQ